MCGLADSTFQFCPKTSPGDVLPNAELLLLTKAGS